jgi:ferredoxin, 2Fe-2S
VTDSTKKLQIQIESQRNLATRGVFADEELTLLANLLENNVEIDNSCGGYGTCGTCCVLVVEGLSNFSDVGEIEAEMKADRGFKENERLSCQSYIKGDIKIKIP